MIAKTMVITAADLRAPDKEALRDLVTRKLEESGFDLSRKIVSRIDPATGDLVYTQWEGDLK